MTAHELIELALRVASEARPPIGARIIHDPGPDGVHLDVSTALQEVALRVDDPRAIAAFPQRARAPVPPVEMADVRSPQRLHHACRRGRVRGGDEQMRVIRHEHIRVDRAARAIAGMEQRRQIVLAILVVDETGGAVVPALYDVERMAGQDESE